MYFEGCDFGAYNYHTEFFNKFSANYIDDGYPSSIGNINSLSGQNNTITLNLDYEYLYQQDPDNYVDLISAGGGTIIFQDQNQSDRTILYEDSSSGTKTICSTFIFGALRDGTSTKQDLMDIYLNYLKGN